MRIIHAEIAGFGQFHQREFDFADGLQVVYGTNESGKSTLRAFILGMLFGFPSRRHPLARYEPKATSQYGGSLDLEVDGQTYRLTRLGDQPATLVDLASQAPQPLSLLEHWLAPYDEAQYKQLFTFNQAELTALKTLGADDLNTQLQTVGLVGSAPWRATATALRDQADELYKPRGRKPELNQALRQYHELETQVAAARSNYPEYQRLQTQIQTLAAQQTSSERQLAELNTQQQHLANLRNQWPVYQQLTQLRARMTTTAPRLTPATVSAAKRLSEQQTTLQHALASARQQLSTQPVDSASQGLVGFYIQHQTEFETLESQLPTLQQAFGQYQVLTRQVAEAKGTAEAQRTAHPELVACLAPDRQGPLRTLKQTLADWQPVSRQQRATPTRQLDWRLIAGGIGVVAGLLLPLGGFKWILALAGLGLLGWFGWEELNPSQATPAENTTTQPDLAAQLSAAGLAPDLSVDAARQRLETIAELQRVTSAVTSAEQHAATQASRVWRSLQDYEFAAGWIPVSPEHLDTSVQRVQQFYEQVHQTMQQQTMSGADFAYTQRQVQQLTTRVRDVTGQLQQLATDNDLADVEALNAALSDQAQQRADADSVAQLNAQLSADEQRALAAYQDLDQLQQAISAGRQKLTTLQTELTQRTAALVTAQTQLKRLTEDGRYTALRQQQANLQTTITVLARQWVTRQLGAAWIERALQTLTDQQLPAVLARGTVNFARLTDKRYNKIELDGPQLDVLASDGQKFTVAELSTATKEQLYLAIRLALIVHLKGQAQLPIMIDDGLVNFDDARRSAAWDLLAEVAQDHQLIYFTNETAARTALPAATVLDLT